MSTFNLPGSLSPHFSSQSTDERNGTQRRYDGTANQLTGLRLQKQSKSPGLETYHHRQNRDRPLHWPSPVP